MAMAPGDLVTLDAVKTWLGNPKVNVDASLARLIRMASIFVCNALNRNNGFGYQLVSDTYDGNGNSFMVLREAPVIDIMSLDLGNGQLVTASTGSPPGPGYRLEAISQTSAQQVLALYGYRFPKGRQNVSISYHTGYVKAAEAHTIPAAPGPYTAQTLFSWLGDRGVTYAIGGAALTAITTGVPSVGQYLAVDGVYTFAAADAGKGVLMSYSFCPEDVAQAVIELVGERYKAATRIGEVSHSLGGQTTISFSQKDMNAFIATLLQNYKEVTPA